MQKPTTQLYILWAITVVAAVLLALHHFIFFPIPLVAAIVAYRKMRRVPELRTRFLIVLWVNIIVLIALGAYVVVNFPMGNPAAA
ncbi:hypothetical protein JIM95_004785 [Corynebacterium sp. CCM 8835]|uniref:Secreted protein n=1 Tax=Corynebacterium antarcticum TaxID=2800405 RepID=A0ABS1FL99_9CORY|nr:MULTISPECIES: hypothetical protein [Corynebacterium]MBV7293457.1 hypothetical protein [Corynebacterium sp. TAE3-ERU16]MCL0245461.1 hypothetical protein [Corynebacterium antarcticum]